MIYIISEKVDLVTDLVIEWIVTNNKSYRRLNDDDFICGSSEINDLEYRNSMLEDAKKVWHRRGCLNLIPPALSQNFTNKILLMTYFYKETSAYISYIEGNLRRRLKENYIGSFEKETYTNNKLTNLEIAKEVGFKIPNSLITSKKESLLRFKKTHEKIITKDLRTPVNIKTRNKQYVSTGVKVVTEDMISRLESTFVPIFVQNLVPKKYEVRVFVTCGKLYSMAIFSQNDESTKIDYRNYNRSKPNRCVPISIVDGLGGKIWDFMKRIDMNTGSIDFIVTPDNEYVFLEVNPMGQFHWISANCNYYIEKEIAKFLSK